MKGHLLEVGEGEPWNVGLLMRLRHEGLASAASSVSSRAPASVQPKQDRPLSNREQLVPLFTRGQTTMQQRRPQKHMLAGTATM